MLLMVIYCSFMHRNTRKRGGSVWGCGVDGVGVKQAECGGCGKYNLKINFVLK